MRGPQIIGPILILLIVVVNVVSFYNARPVELPKGEAPDSGSAPIASAAPLSLNVEAGRTHDGSEAATTAAAKESIKPADARAELAAALADGHDHGGTADRIERSDRPISSSPSDPKRDAEWQDTPELDWTWFLETWAPPDRNEPVVFHRNLAIYKDQRVRVAGLMFLLKSRIKDGRITACVLMPASMATCCGPACQPTPEKMVYVDLSANPIPVRLYRKKGLQVEFRGVLKLEDEASLDCLYTLREAEARLFDVMGGYRFKLYETPARGPADR